MRIATLGLLAALVSASGAAAADLDYGYLRGADDDYVAAPDIDWSGFYVGGHGGYSSGALGFSNSMSKIYSEYFRSGIIESEFVASSLLALPDKRIHSTTYGAYAGYNVQFDDIVVGLEADYTYFGRFGLSYGNISRFVTTSKNMVETINLRGYSKTELEDYGTIRGRAGYAFGSFLPFVTAGIAIGRATISEQPEVQSYGYDANGVAAYQTDPKAGIPYNHGYDRFNPNNPNLSTPSGFIKIPVKEKSKAMAGVALGAGLEFALTSNIVLRGEYQYILFNDFDGHKINVNTVRGGAAVKF